MERVGEYVTWSSSDGTFDWLFSQWRGECGCWEWKSYKGFHCSFQVTPSPTLKIQTYISVEQKVSTFFVNQLPAFTISHWITSQFGISFEGIYLGICLKQCLKQCLWRITLKLSLHPWNCPWQYFVWKSSNV